MKLSLPNAILTTVLVLTLNAMALEPGDIAVTITANPGTPAFAHRVSVQPGPGGSHYVETSITNRSDADAFLSQITITLPWGDGFGDGWMLATGGGCMFNSPTTVHPQPKPEAVSTSFLLARHAGGHDFAGFLTWRTFRTELSWRDGRLVATADGEGRRVRPGEELKLEKIWLTRTPHWQDLLFAYADEIVRENKITLRPRPQYVGWSNWDYYGAHMTNDQIMGNLDRLLALNVGANVLQVDGGWATKSGDYLDPRPIFPGGMKGLADELHRRGLQAGLHFDGMRADHNSKVVTEHPEYFLKDQHGEIIGLAEAVKSGKRTRVYFDFSHPGAREHMRRAIHTIRHEWGYDYFKFDFLKFAFPKFIYQDTPGVTRENTRIVPHDDALTSMERSHLALATFRSAMGDDAYFMACTAEFGPVYGHVDALRTGGDIDPTYSRFSRACMENGGNFYLHGTVVRVDADYHVARGRLDEDAELTKNPRKTGGDMPYALAEMWTHYVGLFGGPKLSSDNLNILREERKELFRRAVRLPACERFVPVDFWAHGRDRDDPFCVFLGEAGGTTYLAVFNWSETPREFKLGGIAADQSRDLQLLSGTARFTAGGAGVNVSLDGRSSAVFQLNPSAKFDLLRNTLNAE
jgi:alpha-galactosidase